MKVTPQIKYVMELNEDEMKDVVDALSIRYDDAVKAYEEREKKKAKREAGDEVAIAMDMAIEQDLSRARRMLFVARDALNMKTEVRG